MQGTAKGHTFILENGIQESHVCLCVVAIDSTQR